MCDKDLTQQAKDYFAQIRKTDRLIQRLTSTVATLRSSLTSQSYELKPDKVQTSGGKNPLEDAMIKIDTLERKINARIDELVDLREQAFTMIKNVPDLDQQNVLIGRYCEDKKWEKIAVELNFSIRHVHRLHGSGLLEFAKNNPEILKDGTQCQSET